MGGAATQLNLDFRFVRRLIAPSLQAEVVEGSKVRLRADRFGHAWILEQTTDFSNWSQVLHGNTENDLDHYLNPADREPIKFFRLRLVD